MSEISIEQGNNGQVRHEIRDGNHVLVKEFSNDCFKLLNWKNCFNDEISLYEKANHKLLPKKISHEERKSVVLDFIPGCSLFEFRRHVEFRELNLGHQYAIAYLLCEQLKAIHDAGYIHRDISPTNIRIDPYYLPHIIDYGDCKFVDNSTIASSNNHGNGLYCAPEVVSAKKFSSASDIYAMSCTLYFLFTNNEPYSGIKNKCFEEDAKIAKLTVMKEKIKEFMEDGDESKLLEMMEDKDLVPDLQDLEEEDILAFEKDDLNDVLKEIEKEIANVKDEIKAKYIEMLGALDTMMLSLEYPFNIIILKGVEQDPDKRPKLEEFMEQIDKSAEKLKEEELNSYRSLKNHEIPDIFGTEELIQLAISKRMMQLTSGNI